MLETLEKAYQPYYQFQFNGDKQEVGAEILMRSCHDYTDNLIRVLTNKNGIHLLDLFAFKCALKFQGVFNISCSSNFSAKSISNDEVVKELCVLDYRASTKIELTESDMLSSEAVANLVFLNNVGFDISLDDYGSDRNGLNRIVALPLCEIKIDRYLVSQLPESKAIIAIGYTIKMAHKIGFIVVAEGVETQEQFDILARLECDRFQGYLLHKPEEFDC